MRLIFIAIGMMLLFGCTSEGTTGANQTAPTQPNITQPDANDSDGQAGMTCDEYCRAQPHIQCVGSWNISGTYPDCVCSFVCDTQEANDTNLSGELPGTLPDDIVAVTILNVSSLMSDGVSKIRSDFYGSHDGSFNEKTYTWTYSASPSEPGDISFDSPVSVQFDEKPISTLRASAFTVFTDKATDEDHVEGLAIFLTHTTPLDSVTSPFNVEYLNPAIGKELTGCETYENVHLQDLEKQDMLVYYFSCTGIEDI